jgi:5-formyltetrahydrofolate cyclo-ligase
MQSKEYYRQKYKTLHKELFHHKDNFQKISTQVNYTLTNLLQTIVQPCNAVSKIGFYCSFETEISVSQTINKMIKQHSTILFPKMFKQTLEFYQCSEEDYSKIIAKFQQSAKFKNLLEPAKTKQCFTPQVVILTGLSFDETGVRLGYGGGFYDRFFHSNNACIKIALCPEEVIEKTLPYENYDIKMNYIITQERLIVIKKK